MPERKEFYARINEDLFKMLEAEAQRTGNSINGVLNKVLDKGFTQQEDQVPAMRLILLKYPTRCLKCQHDLPAQTWAMYGKGVGAICVECFIEKLGDKAIVKKVMRLKELRWTIKALEKQVDLKSDELRKLDFLQVIITMRNGYGEIHKLVMDYLKTGFEKPEREKKAMDELERLIEKQWAIIEEARLFLMGPAPEIKKKSKKKPYVT